MARRTSSPSEKLKQSSLVAMDRGMGLIVSFVLLINLSVAYGHQFNLARMGRL
jgi:hypothetical protein